MAVTVLLEPDQLGPGRRAPVNVLTISVLSIWLWVRRLCHLRGERGGGAADAAEWRRRREGEGVEARALT